MSIKKMGEGNTDTGFYTPSRAIQEIYSVFKGVEDAITIKFPNGDIFSLEALETDGFVFSHNRGSSIIKKQVIDKEEVEKGFSYKIAESLLNFSITESGFDKIQTLSSEDIIRTVLEKNIKYSNYSSDLYLPKNEQITEMLSRYEFNNNVSVFISDDTGEAMYEFPFIYDEKIFNKIKEEIADVQNIPSSLPKDIDKEDKELSVNYHRL